MGLTFDIRYHQDVVRKDIPALSSSAKQRIREAVEAKLTTHPEQFGKPLRKSLKGYRKLRVGDHRVIFRIEERLVFVLMIQHRSTVYEQAEKRSL